MKLHDSMFRALSGILLGSFICAAACNSNPEPDAGLKELAADFRAANRASTIEPMLKLYFLEGSDELNITRLKGALQYELGLPIEKIEFEPLSGASEEKIQFTQNGIRYGPTLEPRYRMRVIYKSADRFTSLFTVGKTDSNTWRFISAKPML